MLRHLNLKSVPELSGLSWLDRNRAFRRCLRQRGPWSWWTYYIIFVCIVVAIASFTAGRSSLPRWSHPMIVFAVMVLAIIVCELAMKFFFLRNHPHTLRVYLRARCLHCGHNLRTTFAAGQATCPECGRTISPIQQKLAAEPTCSQAAT